MHVPGDHPVPELGKRTDLRERHDRQGPREREAGCEREQPEQPATVPVPERVPAECQTECHQKDAGLLPDQRGPPDTDAGEKHVGEAAAGLGTHMEQQGTGRWEGHEHFGRDRGKLALRCEQCEPGRRGRRHLAARQASRRAAQHEARRQDPEDAEDVHREDGQPAEQSGGSERKVRERRLDVGDLSEWHRPLEHALGDDGKIRFVDVEHAEDESGAAQGEDRGEQRGDCPEPPRRPTHRRIRHRDRTGVSAGRA